MPEQAIQITIIDDSTSQKCDIECGVDWSSVDALTLAKQRIQERFGNKAHLEYFDLPKMADNRHARELKQISGDLPLPLLLINGQPRISGQFDIRQIMDAIEVNLEIEGR